MFSSYFKETIRLFHATLIARDRGGFGGLSVCLGLELEVILPLIPLSPVILYTITPYSFSLTHTRTLYLSIYHSSCPCPAPSDSPSPGPRRQAREPVRGCGHSGDNLRYLLPVCRDMHGLSRLRPPGV